MSSLFDSDKKPLTYLLDQIENRELALPDFQRSFVWDPGDTRELVVSIIQSFPAGSLLLMRGGAAVFKPRAFEGAPELTQEPTFLVLDGQQRLTSLYQAFSGHGSHRYFLNIQDLIDGDDLDEAVEVYPARRAEKWVGVEGQARDLTLPLARLRTFAYWRDDVLELRAEAGEDVQKLRRQLNDLEKEFIKPVEQYQFPLTTLASKTPTEAVCTIFETLNRKGIKLSPFELITARAFAQDIRLREMWRQSRLDHGALEDFEIDPYYILQVIALIVRRTPKRSAVLKLEVNEIVEHWDAAVAGMANILEMLRSECGVLVRKWLPYQTALITMAAAWPKVEATPGPAVGDRRAKLQRYFWSSAFMGAYDNAVNTQSETDLPAILKWFEGGDPPEVVSGFSFNPDRWRYISPRQRALYKATIALLLRGKPKDFHKGVPLDKEVIEAHAVDDHHIFPRKYLQEQGLSQMIDSVLNHTLIDKKTNIRIGGRAPSKYLAEMKDEVGESLLATILESHNLSAEEDGPLLQDEYEGFLDWRLDRLKQLLSGVLGADFAISPEEVEGPETAEARLEVVDEEEASELLSQADLDDEEEEPVGTQLPVLAREVVELLRSRSRTQEDAAALEDLLRQIVSWEGTVAELGRSKRNPDGLTGYVMVRRVPRRKGVFIYVSPKNMKATLRLKDRDVDLSELKYAERRNVKEGNRYQFRIDLKFEEARAEAVRLTRLAYDRAG